MSASAYVHSCTSPSWRARSRLIEDGTTEICGVRVLGQSPLDLFNSYRPPIRATGDDRQDRFGARRLPDGARTLLVGDVNGHHPAWDDSCEEADSGERLADWMEDIGWTPLNGGALIFTSYQSGILTAPISPPAASTWPPECNGRGVTTRG